MYVQVRDASQRAVCLRSVASSTTSAPRKRENKLIRSSCYKHQQPARARGGTEQMETHGRNRKQRDGTRRKQDLEAAKRSISWTTRLLIHAHCRCRHSSRLRVLVLLLLRLLLFEQTLYECHHLCLDLGWFLCVCICADEHRHLTRETIM